VIPVADISAQSFDILLDYVYTGKLSVDVTNVKQVADAAEKLKISTLLRACGDFQ